MIQGDFIYLARRIKNSNIKHTLKKTEKLQKSEFGVGGFYCNLESNLSFQLIDSSGRRNLLFGIKNMTLLNLIP